MTIAGLQKTTLLDFPGKVACTVFLRGCNFRCPFCQNGELLGAGEDAMTEQELFAFLQKRRGILDGVCVTGGEPLLRADIADFLRRIREAGFAVKLDTNGAFPEKLSALCEEGLVDHVAMDIKNSPERYAKTAGCEVDMGAIRASAALLMQGETEYEFRTTVVRELHRAEDFLRIGEWLRGAKRYFLQSFRDSDGVLRRGLSPCSDAEMRAFKKLLLPYIPSALLRGEN